MDLNVNLFLSNNSQFTHELKVMWEDKFNQNILRYSVDDIPKKVLGEYVIQLNPNRGSKRRQPDNIFSVTQSFDESKFNFTKVAQNEVIFELTMEKESNLHRVLVNVSPISKYHSLLCPFIDQKLPQILTLESFKIALEIACHTNDDELKVGFNGLCAFASVNHLHFHLFYEQFKLPVQGVKCSKIKGPLYRLADDYPAFGFCFETNTATMEKAADNVMRVVKHFLDKSIAHNLMIARGESVRGIADEKVVRVFLWPRKSSYGAKHATELNVAVCELSGWFTVYDKTTFDTSEAEHFECELKRWNIENFEVLCQDLSLLF